MQAMSSDSMMGQLTFNVIWDLSDRQVVHWIRISAGCETAFGYTNELFAAHANIKTSWIGRSSK